MFTRFTQRFTKPARAVVQRAVVRVEADHGAGGAGDGQVHAADLLVVMLEDTECLASRVLVQQGVDLAELRVEVLRRKESHVAGLGEEDAAALAAIGIDLDEVLRHLDRPRPLARRRRGPRVARSAKQALEHSLREAIALRHNYIGTEHLLLGLARADDPVVTDSLHGCGTSYEALRDGVREALRRVG